MLCVNNMTITDDEFAAIAFIFERDNGNTPGDYESQVINESGLSNIPSESLVNEIVETLNQQNNLSDSYRVSAYWALSKRHDTSLIPHFRKWLKSELSKEDRKEYRRLCLPDSPDFILNIPDYYAFFTYTMFRGKVKK